MYVVTDWLCNSGGAGYQFHGTNAVRPDPTERRPRRNFRIVRPFRFHEEHDEKYVDCIFLMVISRKMNEEELCHSAVFRGRI